MRIDSPENARRRRNRKQTRQEQKPQQQSILEKELYAILEKSMEAALD